MVSIRRVVDRYFALGLAAIPAYSTLVDIVGPQTAQSWTLGSLVVLVVLAVLLAEYGPNHTSGEAWRFGFATLVAYVAVWLAVDYGLGYRLGDEPIAGLAVWLVSLSIALVRVSRRRSAATVRAS